MNDFLKEKLSTLREKLLRPSVLVIVALVLASCCLLFVAEVNAREKAAIILDLQNQLAQSSETVENQKGVFEKLTVQSENLQSILDTRSEEVRKLQEIVKKKDEEILTANRLAVHWRHAYEARLTDGVTSYVPSDGGVVEVPTADGGAETFSDPVVTFTHDFGPFIVSGRTVASSPPQAFLRVDQGRPLRISLLVTQAEDKSWRTRVTSSEENMTVDVELSGVNPFILEKKWYENIGITADLGYADGLLVGIGATYKIGHFHVGPKAWVSVSDRFGKYFGLTVMWMPFER